LRPLTTPYSFVTPQKSKQKRAPDLLARCHASGSLRSHTSHRAFAIRCAQLSGLFQREPALLRRRHTGKEEPLPVPLPFGVPSFAYFSWASKKSKALPGAPGGVE